MKVARILVSFDFLREALHLPPCTEIKAVRSYDSPDLAEITLTHPDLRDVDVAPGEGPPIVSPTFRRNVPVEFLDWGQP